jgi:hypothetical protein
MAETKTPSPSKPQNPAVSRARRKIYIKERLPQIMAEMKALSEERKELIAKRKEAQPNEEAQPGERKEINRRSHFVVERIAVLRSERAALRGERDGLSSQREQPEPKAADA